MVLVLVMMFPTGVEACFICLNGGDGTVHGQQGFGCSVVSFDELGWRRLDASKINSFLCIF